MFLDVNRVLVVLAHPDDMEVNCGGLIARLNYDKKLVRLVVTTTGGKGSKNTRVLESSFGQTRVNEQMAAGKILGISPEPISNVSFFKFESLSPIL